MHILITGAAGMIGRKLLERLVRDGGLGGKPVSHVTLQDLFPATVPAGAVYTADVIVSDFTEAGEAVRLVANRPDVVFHLAAVVSGDAEADFDKGYRVNLDGMRQLLEAIRAIGAPYKPRFVFTSGGAVFGTPLPDPIDDEFMAAPLSSYGTQKASCSCPTTPGAASSTAWASASRPSAFGLARPTRRPLASSRESSASRSTGRKPFFRSPPGSATG